MMMSYPCLPQPRRDGQAQWVLVGKLSFFVLIWPLLGEQLVCLGFLDAFLTQVHGLISHTHKDQQGFHLLVFFEQRIRDFHVTQHITAEDVASEAIFRGMIHIYKKAEPIRYPAAWLCKTGFNIIREVHRKHHREHALADRPTEVAIAPPDPEPTFTEQHALLRQALAQLSARDRQMLTLRHVNDWSWQQVARAVGSTEATARQRGHRAKRRLQALLTR